MKKIFTEEQEKLYKKLTGKELYNPNVEPEQELPTLDLTNEIDEFWDKYIGP